VAHLARMFGSGGSGGACSASPSASSEDAGVSTAYDTPTGHSIPSPSLPPTETRSAHYFSPDESSIETTSTPRHSTPRGPLHLDDSFHRSGGSDWNSASVSPLDRSSLDRCQRFDRGSPSDHESNSALSSPIDWPGGGGDEEIDRIERHGRSNHINMNANAYANGPIFSPPPPQAQGGRNQHQHQRILQKGSADYSSSEDDADMAPQQRHSYPAQRLDRLLVQEKPVAAPEQQQHSYPAQRLDRVHKKPVDNAPQPQLRKSNSAQRLERLLVREKSVSPVPPPEASALHSQGPLYKNGDGPIGPHLLRRTSSSGQGSNGVHRARPRSQLQPTNGKAASSPAQAEVEAATPVEEAVPPPRKARVKGSGRGVRNISDMLFRGGVAKNLAIANKNKGPWEDVTPVVPPVTAERQQQKQGRRPAPKGSLLAVGKNGTIRRMSRDGEDGGRADREEGGNGDEEGRGDAASDASSVRSSSVKSSSSHKSSRQASLIIAAAAEKISRVSPLAKTRKLFQNHSKPLEKKCQPPSPDKGGRSSPFRKSSAFSTGSSSLSKQPSVKKTLPHSHGFIKNQAKREQPQDDRPDDGDERSTASSAVSTVTQEPLPARILAPDCEDGSSVTADLAAKTSVPVAQRPPYPPPHPSRVEQAEEEVPAGSPVRIAFGLSAVQALPESLDRARDFLKKKREEDGESVDSMSVGVVMALNAAAAVSKQDKSPLPMPMEPASPMKMLGVSRGYKAAAAAASVGHRPVIGAVAAPPQIPKEEPRVVSPEPRNGSQASYFGLEPSVVSNIAHRAHHEHLDLSSYYVQPRDVRKLLRRYRQLCGDRNCEESEDAKKALALLEIRSRVMESDIERGLDRQGGTVPVDDLALTLERQRAMRVRDAIIVAKAWRDGASPKDVTTAAGLTLKATHSFYVPRGPNGEREEITWFDDMDLFLMKCPSLGARSIRGFDLFTLGDCQSLLLKLTNERCSELRKKLEDAAQRQLEAEDVLSKETESSEDLDCNDFMTDAEMEYLEAMEETKTVSKDLVLAEKGFNLIRDRIQRLVMQYESLLIKIESQADFENSVAGSADKSCISISLSEHNSTLDDEFRDIETKEMLTDRAHRAELRAELAAREVRLAKEEAARIREEKQRELEELQVRLEELEAKSGMDHNQSMTLVEEYETQLQIKRTKNNTKPRNVLCNPDVSLDNADVKSSMQSAISVKDDAREEARERVKAKFRLRSAERLKRPSGKRMPPHKPSVTQKRVARLPVKQNGLAHLKNDMASASEEQSRLNEEEMYQHLDFYERSLQAVEGLDRF